MLNLLIGLALGAVLSPQIKSAGKELAALATKAWEKVK